MTQAEIEAKRDGANDLPKGCVRAKGPDGTTDIIVRAPRGPGPWFRVKNIAYGHRLIQAATPEEAVRKFYEEFNPGFAQNAEWCAEHMRLNAGRVTPLAGTEAPKPAAPTATPEKGKQR